MSRSVTERLTGGRLAPAATLGLLVALVYGVAFGFDFVRWDDPVNVTHNPLLTEPWSLGLLARLLNGDTALRFKPLSWLLYRATYALFGFNPAAWHALNLSLHLVAVLLFWAVMRATLARLRPGAPAGTRALLAWLAAAVWAVHPAHVEPACWVTATPYPLMVSFLLGSFWFYLRATDPGAPAAARRNFLGAWGLALAAYASYPVGVTYGAWLVVADVWILRIAPLGPERRAAFGRWALRHAAFLVPAIASVLVTWRSSATTPWLYPAPATLAEVDIGVRLKMAAAMLGSVWTHFFWPFGLTPNNPMLPPALVRGPLILGLAAGSLGLLVGAALRRVRSPGFTGTVFGVTVLALPVLGFTQWPSWAVADRHVYLPHLVVCGALAVGLAARPAAARRAPGFVLAAAALVAALAVLAHAQVRVWRNTDSLFGYLEAQPAFTWNPSQQAYIYQLWGAQAEEDGAVAAARARQAQARRVLQAGMLAAAGAADWPGAIELSQRLEQTFGLPPVLRRERVKWWLQLGRRAEAEADFERVRRETPADPANEELRRAWPAAPAPAAGNHL